MFVLATYNSTIITEWPPLLNVRYSLTCRSWRCTGRLSQRCWMQTAQLRPGRDQNQPGEERPHDKIGNEYEQNYLSSIIGYTKLRPINSDQWLHVLLVDSNVRTRSSDRVLVIVSVYNQCTDLVNSSFRSCSLPAREWQHRSRPTEEVSWWPSTYSTTSSQTHHSLTYKTLLF